MRLTPKVLFETYQIRGCHRPRVATMLFVNLGAVIALNVALSYGMPRLTQR